MPTALESRAALTLVTGSAVSAVQQILGSLTGSPESVRADLLDAVPAVIGYYADGSSALAADFYDDERERAAVRGRFLAEPVVLDRGEKIGRAVAWAAKPLFDGSGDASARLAEVVQLETARPYRDTITTNRQRDPQAAGWQRVASGGCSFCRMLAGRGAVYRESTARFASHANCHCTAAPVFKGGEAGPEASVVQYVASKRRPHGARPGAGPLLPCRELRRLNSPRRRGYADAERSICGHMEEQVSDGTGDGTQGAQENGAQGGEAKTFTQDEVNQLVGQARTDERRKVSQKFSDYDDLKAKAGSAVTAEERIANLEKEIAASRVEALRARYAADVPESLRPLLTATTDDDLKAQRDLILQGVTDRKKQGNVAPTEGGNQNPGDADSELRDFTRQLFQRAD